jgi:hypothetical protein
MGKKIKKLPMLTRDREQFFYMKAAMAPIMHRRRADFHSSLWLARMVQPCWLDANPAIVRPTHQ